MAFLTAVVSILDASGNRIDTPTTDGVRQPIVLQLASGLSGAVTHTGGLTKVTITNTGGGRTLGNGLEENPAGTERVKMTGDGSIVVDASGVKVGTISDAQHGQRAGGNLHELATTEADGFMPLEDRADLDAAGATGASTLARRGEDGALEQTTDAVSTAVVTGVRVVNSTAATLAAAQYSPAVTLTSQSAPEAGASVATTWAVQGRPRNGGFHKSDLWIGYDINGGGFNAVITVGYDGVIACAGVTTPTLDTTGALAIGASATGITLGAAGVATSLPGDVTAGTLTIGTKRVDPYNVNATAKTADYTAALGDLVRCDPSAAGFTVTLPSAASNAGRGVTIKNVTTSTNAITIDTTGSETIDDAASYSLATSRGTATFVSDGTNWMAFPPAV